LPSIEYYATGRRKTSAARVFLRPGTGTITINHREFDQFFPTETLRMTVRRPLVLTENLEKFDVLATVAGGGVNGQAGAVRLGIARALVDFDAELRKSLKKEGLLTSDSRVKEREKDGVEWHSDKVPRASAAIGGGVPGLVSGIRVTCHTVTPGVKK